MAAQLEARTEDLIEKILEESRHKIAKVKDEQLEAFIRLYYRRVSADDLLEHSAIDLGGAALAHWHLARLRNRDENKVHIYNPTHVKHGWQSTHTIVEIVTDDMPFLVDSASMALKRRGLTTHLTIHPVVKIERDEAGKLLSISEPFSGAEGTVESLMHFQVDRQTNPDVLVQLTSEIEKVLDDVRKACADWQTMRQKVVEIVEELDRTPAVAGPAEIAEATEFGKWIADDHFTFLGYCEYGLRHAPGNGVSEELGSVEPGTELGILRNHNGDTSRASVLPTETQEYGQTQDLLVVAKANTRSTIHRPAYMDFIGIKRFDSDGKVNGERCILGLFTSAAYNRSTREIPLLRQKVKRVMEHSGLPPSGHGAKALQNIIETYPRDSLFQTSEHELFSTTMGILELQERQKVRLFVRRDNYGRFYSCLVFVPRERYSRELRVRIQNILMHAFEGTGVEFDTLFSESTLARIQFTVHVEPGGKPKYATKEIERQIIEAERSWQDKFRDALTDQYGEEQGIQYFHRYADAFSGAYREDFSARTGAFDVQLMERTVGSDGLEISFYRPLVETEGGVRLKLFSSGKAVPPSDALPIIENMGLKVVGERPYKASPVGAVPIWIHEFQVIHAEGADIDIDEVGEKFQSALARIWSGQVENDGFNRLVLGAGLTWRETSMLRAYCRYLRQIRIRFSETYMIETLAHNPNIVALLVDLFNIRFEPDGDPQISARGQSLVAEIEQQLDAVANLDEDRILRSFLNVVQATLRTNYFQRSTSGEYKSYLSFKVDPSKITRMPDPRPMFEIFVYSPRTEAVHLRGGRVARGGLRWSDRREDFRTEVLGLVKAQMVKNAVIVPTGSKGGFVVKRPQSGLNREQLMTEVVECYKIFMRGMLDITDNLSGGEVIPPENVVRHDDDDPYLVIAADKGTATFSDIANGIAKEYDFWLGDAFASGGSVGYDHKKMAITARGAWESVKRHFRELGIDTQRTDFTAIGIGDMGGDVFGNGMLLSRHIKLIGAFNHQHIFLDSNPDPQSSYEERKRLFHLPRSSWTDYNKDLISPGGGVYPRSAKSIILSTETQQSLGIKADALTPNELINAMLKAPVDLLWNGGIGTYVKAQSETNDDVRDRANDAVRVNGEELRCRVVGEGGNLGVTQLGRIEYAKNGGKIYTDSIDNSGGVDCSDHEVNIKILLNAIVANGDMTEKQRNQLLMGMTDEVAELVLKDNYGQTQAISVAANVAPSLLDEHMRFMRDMERLGRLDRNMEFLPDDDDIAERRLAQQGLTRPELAILLSYSKVTLYESLIASDVPEDPFLSHELERYFPKVLGERFSDQMYGHRLRREIIATHVTNNMVNRMGPTFSFRMWELSGAEYADIARAYTATHEIFAMHTLWEDIEAMDNRIAAQTQSEMLSDAGGLVERATLWLLRNMRPPLGIANVVDYFTDGIAELSRSFPKPLAAASRLTLKKRTKHLVSAGVPQALAVRVAGLVAMSSALDIVEVAKATKREVALAAAVYFSLGSRLELLWLRDQIAKLVPLNQWHTLAKSSLRNQLHNQQRSLTGKVLRQTNSTDRPKAIVDTWVAENKTILDRFSQITTDLKASGSLDFAMLSVAVSEAQRLLRTSESPQPSALPHAAAVGKHSAA